MAQEILKVLHEMEQELAKIKSAKEQVDAVLAADENINKNLENYALALSGLSEKLQNLINTIQNAANSVSDDASKFSAALKERQTDINNSSKTLAELLSDFKRQTETLSTIFSEKTQIVLDKIENASKTISAAAHKDISKAKSELENTINSSNQKLFWLGIGTLAAVIVDVIFRFV